MKHVIKEFMLYFLPVRIQRKTPLTKKRLYWLHRLYSVSPSGLDKDFDLARFLYLLSHFIHGLGTFLCFRSLRYWRAG